MLDSFHCKYKMNKKHITLYFFLNILCKDSNDFIVVRRNMQKKLVCIVVFLMMSSFVFVFLFDTVHAAGSPIFVNGDNTVGPWDGSSGHPFQFIQDGIDAVTENGTVYVFAGIYRGNIVINKTINVNRTGKGNVIIDGCGVERCCEYFC